MEVSVPGQTTRCHGEGVDEVVSTLRVGACGVERDRKELGPNIRFKSM